MFSWLSSRVQLITVRRTRRPELEAAGPIITGKQRVTSESLSPLYIA